MASRPSPWVVAFLPVLIVGIVYCWIGRAGWVVLAVVVAGGQFPLFPNTFLACLALSGLSHSLGHFLTEVVEQALKEHGCEDDEE